MTSSCTATTGGSKVQQGIIAVFFENGQRSLRPALLSLKNEYLEIITASFNAHLTGDTGLEIVLVRGEGARIKSLEQQLVLKRGIRSVRLTLIPS